jgi:thiol-disulfide isomerase/thioredoxin
MVILRLFLVFFFFFAACKSSNDNSNVVHPIDGQGLQRLVAQKRGKVVLMNFWATWCQPCVEEFPDLLKAVRAFQARGVEFIFVTIDEPEDIQKKVMPFLEKQGINFPTYIKRTKDNDVFINAVDGKWSGAIPATFIYDANGVLAKRFVGQQNFKIFSEALDPLVPPNVVGQSY